MVRWDAVATGGACLSVALGLFVCLIVGASLLNEPPATECLVNGQRTGDIGGGFTALVRVKGENRGGERGDATAVISKDVSGFARTTLSLVLVCAQLRRRLDLSIYFMQAACGKPCLGKKPDIAFPCQWDATKDAVVSAVNPHIYHHSLPLPTHPCLLLILL